MFKLFTEASTDKAEQSHPHFKPKGFLFITFTLALACSLTSHQTLLPALSHCESGLLPSISTAVVCCCSDLVQIFSSVTLTFTDHSVLPRQNAVLRLCLVFITTWYCSYLFIYLSNTSCLLPWKCAFAQCVTLSSQHLEQCLTWHACCSINIWRMNKRANKLATWEQS